jgi:putative membrane protein
MSDYPTLLQAQFDRAAMKQYFILQPMLPLALTIVLIPIIPVFVLIAWFLIDKYLDRLSCELTERTLEIRKGFINRVESTIPLEKITDLQMYQGPLMRYLGIRGFRVETAGQSSGPTGHLVNMVGIIDTPEFRQAVLRQRDQSDGNHSKAASAAVSPPIAASADDTQLLTEIRDVLMRIENKFGQNN